MPLRHSYAVLRRLPRTPPPALHPYHAFVPHLGKPVIGLTGGIGAGKSVVANAFAALGCVVAHSDEHARAALRDPAIKRKHIEWWGDQVIDTSTGELDRGAIARIVFNDPDERKRLEALTHPWIEQQRLKLFAAAPPETPAFVIDAPLLLEAGLDRVCDAVVFVDAAEEVRIERIRGRGWDEEELRRREVSQLPLDAKRSRADYVIRNEGDLSDLEAQVSTILNQVIPPPPPPELPLTGKPRR